MGEHDECRFLPLHLAVRRVGKGSNMRKQICCDTPTRRVRIGWLSFQPDGAISFGLNDRTYISPHFQAQSMIWNAYNRVGIQYIVTSDPAALQPVQNPHFTYHPALVFQFKDGNAPGDQFLFRGIADVGITLMQEGTMPWIRAISAPIAHLQVGGRRQDGIDVEELAVTAAAETYSVRMSIDFIRLEDVLERPPEREWHIPWHTVGIKLGLDLCPEQIATMSWFYFH
jgi:hypothetical protein